MNKLLYIKRRTMDKLVEKTNLLQSDFKLDNTDGVSYYIESNNALGTTKDKYITNGNEGGLWLKGNTNTTIKIGKLLSNITVLNSTEIEKIVTQWKFIYEANTSGVKVSDNIAMVYQMDEVGGSCMAHKESEYFEIYQDIGSKVVYLGERNTLYARALIHDLCNLKTNMRTKAIDRIFFKKEEHKIILEKWAKENGYKNIYNKKDDILLLSTPIEDTYYKVPYADSLTQIVEFNGTHRLSNNWDYEHFSVQDSLQQTTGGSDDGLFGEGRSEDDVWCVDDEEYRDINDTYFCNTNDEYYADGSYLVYVSDMGYYHQDDDTIAYDEDAMEYDFKENLKYVEEDDMWTSSENYCYIDVGCREGEYANMDNIYQLSNGYICHADDEPKYLEDTEEYVIDEDEYFEHDNGLFYSYEEETNDEEEVA